MKNVSSKPIIKCSHFLTGIACIVIASFVGCADSSSPSSDATVTTRTEMASSSVTSSSYEKGSQTILAGGLTCDSLHVSSAALLISSLKMHRDGGSDSSEGGSIRTNPFVATFDASLGAQFVSVVTVPAGTYDRMKFEFHKLKGGLDDELINNPVFADFLNGGSYTVVIKGESYVAGVAYPFVFRSSRTENVQVHLDPSVTFEAGKEYDLVLRFDPAAVFAQVLGRPLDPRDSDNQKEIEARIKLALKMNRR